MNKTLRTTYTTNKIDIKYTLCQSSYEKGGKYNFRLFSFL